MMVICRCFGPSSVDLLQMQMVNRTLDVAHNNIIPKNRNPLRDMRLSGPSINLSPVSQIANTEQP